MVVEPCRKTRALILVTILRVAAGSRVSSGIQGDRSRAADGFKPSSQTMSMTSQAGFRPHVAVMLKSLGAHAAAQTRGMNSQAGSRPRMAMTRKSLGARRDAANASDLVWYLGIGSMMSPIALGMRGIQPVQSLLCEIQDHRKVFYANDGMATLIPEDGAVAQAVAHQMTRNALAVLEAREPPSVPVSARLRGDVPGEVIINGVASVAADFEFLEGVRAQPDQVKASIEQEGTGARGRITMVTNDGVHVSRFGSTEFDTTGVVMIGDQPANVPLSVSRVPPVPCKPSARYLDLMIEGARAVSMDEAEVANLAATPCTPRKSEKELKRLPFNATASDHFFSIADVQKDDTLRVIRGKVFKLPKPQRPLGSAEADLALMASTQMRDPLYGSPPSDPTQPWDGWGFVEDMICSFLPGLKHVGWIQADPGA